MATRREQGTIKKKPTADCEGQTNYKVSGQVHWFGNCRKGYKPYAKCCTNANLLEDGFDWNKFSKGNSCSGDGDRWLHPS